MLCSHCGSTEHFTELCTNPKAKPHDSRFWLALFSVLFFVMGPITAAEINLTDEEKAKCEKEGGCGMVSQAWILQQLEQAFQRGKKVCNSST